MQVGTHRRWLASCGVALAMAAAAPVALGGWEAPQTVKLPRGQAPASALVGLDGAGNATALVGVSGVGTEAVSRPLQRGRWVKPTLIAGAGFTPRTLAVNAAGAASASLDVPAFEEPRAWLRDRGGPWHASVLDPTMQGLRVSTAINAAGDVVAAWEGFFPSIWAATRPALSGVWTAPQQLATNPGQPGSPVVVMADDGRAVVLWGRRAQPREYHLEAATASVGSAFGATQIVIARANFRVSGFAVGAAGRLVLTFEDFPSVFVTELPAGSDTWTTRRMITAKGESAHESALAVDPAGDVTVAWRRLDGIVATVTRPAGASWQAEQPVGPGGVFAFPAVVMDASGRSLLVLRTEAGPLQGYVRPAPTAAWGGPTTITNTADTAPRLAGNSSGQALASWLAGGAVRTALFAPDAT